MAKEAGGGESERGAGDVEEGEDVSVVGGRGGDMFCKETAAESEDMFWAGQQPCRRPREHKFFKTLGPSPFLECASRDRHLRILSPNNVW